MKNYLISFLLFLPVILFSSCTSPEMSRLDKAFDMAGDNEGELHNIIDHFDEDKKTMAEYVVESMIGKYSRVSPGLDSIGNMFLSLPNGKSWRFDSLQLLKAKRFMKHPHTDVYDLTSIKADYIIENIEDALSQKELRVWNNSLTQNQFCELILPYRIGDEPLSTWRSAYREKYKYLSDALSGLTNSVEAAEIVSRAIDKMKYNQQLEIPHRSALNLLHANVGYCRDECDRTLYAMRAFGIPVAIDRILASPDIGNTHEWNVVYDTDDKIFRMFDNYRHPPTRDSIHYDDRRKGKVYRDCHFLDITRLEKFKDVEDAPPELLNPYLTDVTSEYFGHNHAKMHSKTPLSDVYLGVFTPSGYLPIDIATTDKNEITFNDIEPDVIYFPITRNDNRYLPVSDPFLLRKNGEVHKFIADTTCFTTIDITRKMPLRFNLMEKLNSIIGCKIEIGETQNGQWEFLYKITDTPTSGHVKIPLDRIHGKKFIRISKEKKTKPEFAEIIISKDSLARERLPLKVLGPDKSEINTKRNLIDGDILTWYHYKTGKKGIILKIDSEENPQNLFIFPRNDDNFIVPGETYELFYFSSDGWKSLGEKIADSFSVSFRAPDNAVLWLRNKTKGKEEQIFVSRNGKQYFNVDLYDDAYFKE